MAALVLSRHMRSKIKYIVVGAVEYLEDTEIAKYGYVAKYETHPILVYARGKDGLKDDLYRTEDGFSVDNTYTIIPTHIIGSRLTIDEAQSKYPELFLTPLPWFQ